MPLHPAIVHFPIALLLFAGGSYLYGWARPDAFARRMAYVLHLAGSLALIPAIFSGRSVQAELPAEPAYADWLSQHEWMAYVYSWLFGLMLVWQYLRAQRMNASEGWAFTLLYLLVAAFMGYAAHVGGKLVYEFGAGIPIP